jgi:hypothetical protein
MKRGAPKNLNSGAQALLADTLWLPKPMIIVTLGDLANHGLREKLQRQPLWPWPMYIKAATQPAAACPWCGMQFCSSSNK